MQLLVPLGKTSAIYKNMRFTGVQIWNKLDANITIEVNLQSFKNKLKLYTMYMPQWYTEPSARVPRCTCNMTS